MLMLGRKERRDSIDGGVNSDVWRLRCVAEVYLYVMKDLEKKMVWEGGCKNRLGFDSTYSFERHQPRLTFVLLTFDRSPRALERWSYARYSRSQGAAKSTTCSER
jgi:hypothetical protein